MTQRPTETADEILFKVGHVGWTGGGTSWDDKGRTEIVQIFVSHDDRIRSLQFQYYVDGNLVLSARHGSNIASKFAAVKLDYPQEYLTCVSGFSGMDSVSSIGFTTNLAEYGPFGRARKDDEEFEFLVGKDRQFGGFCGSADKCLRSIGVYIKPISAAHIFGQLQL